MSVRKQETIADKIAELLSVKSSSFDPEDNFEEETKAKVTSDNEAGDDDDDDDEYVLSQFRKQNVDLLEDVDKKYAGKKSSRRDLYDSDDDQIENENNEEEGSTSGDEEMQSESDDFVTKDDRNDYSETKDSSDKYAETNDDSNESLETNDDSDESLETNDDSDENLETKEDDEASFTHMDTSALPKELQKGTCVRNQLNIWENLLEMRIQLQKCLANANRMPQLETFVELKESNKSEFADKAANTKQTLSKLLDQLLLLQNLFVCRYPETKTLLKDGKEAKVSDDDDDDDEDEDEEIPSDSNEEEEEIEEEEELKQPQKKKLKLDEYEKEIAEKHRKYSKYRDSVIQKWNEKTRIGTIKKDASTHSILNQIEHNLSDKQKLIKRTQLKRTHFEVIGKNKPDTKEQEENISRIPEEYDPEIFDDNDFYHQLLRELIEVKSADITDPVQLSKQWVRLQNLRSKMKRKIDTRATKGRKIRYAIHSKLVNFMAPIDHAPWTDEAKNELFNSLFGKRKEN